MNTIKIAIALLASALLSFQVAASDALHAVYNVDYSQPDSQRLTQEINSRTRILGMLIIIPASHYGSGDTASFDKDATPLARFAGKITHQIATPMKNLLKGEYRGGVDRYSEGTAYHADWSDKGVKLSVKYQF